MGPVEWGEVRVEFKTAVTLGRLSSSMWQYETGIKQPHSVIVAQHPTLVAEQGKNLISFSMFASGMLSTFLCPETLVSLVVRPIPPISQCTAQWVLFKEPCCKQM